MNIHLRNFSKLTKAKQNDNFYFDVCWNFHDIYEDNPQPLFKPLIKKYPRK